jgi:hypothetical protein
MVCSCAKVCVCTTVTRSTGTSIAAIVRRNLNCATVRIKRPCSAPRSLHVILGIQWHDENMVVSQVIKTCSVIGQYPLEPIQWFAAKHVEPRVWNLDL